MSLDEEKKFVMRHTFIDVADIEDQSCSFGKVETHFNVPWRIYIIPHISDSIAPSTFHIFLQCLKFDDDRQWSIDTTIETRCLININCDFGGKHRQFSHNTKRLEPLGAYEPPSSFGRNLTVECHVTIRKMIGIEKINTFDKKELSDVVLVVKNRKFHVNKMYLAYHSTYFKSLLLGNFEESNQSEMELKDIESWDFQNFLEVIYGDPDINDETVDGILRLGDMYDAKIPVKQCEKFLIKDSKKSLKEKFLMATQNKLENLKKKCMSELKTVEDIAAVMPNEPSQLDSEVWKELLDLSIALHKK